MASSTSESRTVTALPLVNSLKVETQDEKDDKILLYISRVVMAESTMPFLAAAAISVTAINIITAISEGTEDPDYTEWALTIVYGAFIGYFVCRFVHFKTLTNTPFDCVFLRFKYFNPNLGIISGQQIGRDSVNRPTMELIPTPPGSLDSHSLEASQSQPSPPAPAAIGTCEPNLMDAFCLWRPHRLSHRFIHSLSAENAGFALKDMFIVLVLENACEGCGVPLGFGFLYLFILVAIVVVFIPISGYLFSKLFRLSRKQHKMAMSFDADCFALPISYTLMFLLYFLSYPFESAEISEEAEGTGAIDAMFDIFLLTFGITPVLVALFNYNQSQEEIDEEMSNEVVEPEVVTENGTENRMENEIESGKRKLTSSISTVSFKDSQLHFESAVDCYSELFNNSMGYVLGLTFFILTQTYFFTDLHLALDLPSDTVNFIASLLLALAMSYYLPGLFSRLNVQNVVRLKKHLKLQELRRREASSLSKANIAVITNPISGGQTNGSLSEGLINNSTNSTNSTAVVGEIPEHSGPIQLDDDDDAEVFSCSWFTQKALHQLSRHRRALMLAASQLVVGWTWEETIIGAMNLIFSSSTVMVFVDIIVTTLIILIAARVQSYLDQTAASRNKQFEEVKERLALKLLNGDGPKYNGVLSFIIYVFKSAFVFIFCCKSSSAAPTDPPTETTDRAVTATAES